MRLRPSSILAALLCAAASAPAAQAAIVHRYVAPSATGNGSGSDPSNRTSLSTANSNAVAGWVIHLAPGTYSASIDPVGTGTATERIVYVGDQTVASRQVVSGIQLDGNADHVTVRNVRTNGALFVQAISGGSAFQDSIVNCVVGRDVYLRGVDRGVIAACSLGVGSGPSFLKITAEGGATFSATNTRLHRNIMLFTASGAIGSDWRGWWFSGMDRCTLSNNYLRMTISSSASFSGGATAHMRHWYGCTNNYFVDNRSDLYNNNASSGGAYAFNLRDGTAGNTWLRDSTYDLGSYNCKVAFATNGNFQSNNKFSHCIWKIGMYFMWNCTGGADNVTYDHCQFIARNQHGNSVIGQSMMYFIAGTYTNMKFRYCTFYNGGKRLFDTDNASPGWSTLTIKNCLFLSRAPGSDCQAVRIMDPAQMDFDADSNLYFLAKQNVTDVPRLPTWTLRGGPGCAAPGPSGWPCTSYNNECRSLYADPLVTDTTWVNGDIMRPNLQPLMGSPALGLVWKHGYVGALASLVTGPDVVAPAQIQDLGATPGGEPSSAQPAPNPDDNQAGDDQRPGESRSP